MSFVDKKTLNKYLIKIEYIVKTRNNNKIYRYLITEKIKHHDKKTNKF